MSQQSNVLKAYVTRFEPEPEKKEDKVESTEPCSVEETSEEE